MAIQFVKPIETEYDSQFMPLPLDTIYKNIETQQQGLDTARADLNKTQINLKGPFWASQQGAETPIKEKYQSEVDELKERLERDKGNYSVIASKLAEVNQKFQNDPEVQKLVRQELLEKKNIDLGKIAGGTAFMPNIQYVDPVTQEIKFKDWKDVKDEDIVAPVEDKTLEHVNKLVVEKLQEQYRLTYNKPQAFVYKDPASGAYVVLEEPGTTSKKEIIKNNPIISQAIRAASELLALDASGQGRILKEFKENPFVPPVTLSNGQQVVKRGYSNPAELEKFIERAVDIVSYQRTEEKAPKVRVETEGTALDAGSSSGVSPQPIDYNFMLVSGPTVDYTPTSNYSQTLGDLRRTIEGNEATAFNNYILQIADLSATSPKAKAVLDGLDDMLRAALQGEAIDEKKYRFIQQYKENPATTLFAVFNEEGKDDQSRLSGFVTELKEIKDNNETFQNVRAEFFRLMNDLAKDPDEATRVIAEQFFKMNAQISDDKLVANNLERIESQIGKTIISEAFKDSEFLAEFNRLYKDNPKQAEAWKNILLDENSTNARIMYGALGGDKQQLAVLDPTFLEYAGDVFMDALDLQYQGQAREIARNSGEQSIFQALKNFKEKTNITARIQTEEYIKDTSEGEKASRNFNPVLNTLKDHYNKDENSFLTLLQNSGYSVLEKGKSEFNLNDVREIFNNSMIKSPDFKLAGDEEVTISSVDLGSLGESSLPIIYFTVKDKSGRSSTLPIKLPEANKPELSKIIGELIADDNPNVQDKGASIYARVLLNESYISSISTALNISDKSDRLKGTIIDFKLGEEPYQVKIEGKGNYVIGKQTAAGKFAPLAKTKTATSTELPASVSNFSQFLRFMGYHQMQYLSDQGDLAAGESQRQRDATLSSLPTASNIFSGQSGGNTNNTTTSTTGAGGSTGGSLGKFRME
jgi:hypothetical protein